MNFTEAKKEDLGIQILMQEVDYSDTIPTETFLENLRQHKQNKINDTATSKENTL